MYSQKVSIIIPCRNEKDYIDDCVNAILANDYESENLEIIIVDGLSTDGTREIIHKKLLPYKNIKLLDNTAQTTPYAFNIGINNSVGNYIIIVGARHLISSNYISTCIKILDSDKIIGCVGGKVENIYVNKKSMIIASAMASSFGVGPGNFRVKANDGFVDTIGTPAYKKIIFDEIGLFDERLIRNQDDEFNFRLIKQGYKIYHTTKTSISYYVRARYLNLYKQYYQYGFWKVFVNKKHSTITSFRQLVPSAFLLFIIIGLILSFLSYSISLIFGIGICLYVIVGLVNSLLISKRILSVPGILYTFFILHFSYGWGYLAGIIDIIILRGKPGEKTKKLSR